MSKSTLLSQLRVRRVYRPSPSGCEAATDVSSKGTPNFGVYHFSAGTHALHVPEGS
jgi:hypothetical protein